LLYGPRAHPDVDRSRDILEYQIGEREVFIARAWVPLKFNWASVDLIQNAVRDSNVLNNTAAETEDTPAGAENAIGNGNELAASEQSAGVVL
jgi:hypothetical protein